MSTFGDLNRVNTNIQSQNAQFSLNKINRDLAISQQRMTTGLRINKAEDDVSGYAMATKFTSRVSGLTEGLGNVGDAKALLDTAEANINTIIDNLVEIKALATRAGSDSMGQSERDLIATQINNMGIDINDIADQTIWQDIELLNGAADGSGQYLNLDFLVGEREQDLLQVELKQIDVNTLFAGSDALLNTSTTVTAADAFGAGATNATHIAIKVGTGPDAEHITINVGNAEISTWFTGAALSEEGAQALLDTIAEHSAGSEHVRGELTYTDHGTFSGINFRNISPAGTQVTVQFATSANMSMSSTGNAVVIDAPTEPDPSAWGDMNLQGWTGEDYRAFLADVDGAIDDLVGDQVLQIGIAQSSLTNREETISSSIIATDSAISRIMDTDFAKEQSESVRLQILQQTATFALTQANFAPQAVLGFLG